VDCLTNSDLSLSSILYVPPIHLQNFPASLHLTHNYFYIHSWPFYLSIYVLSPFFLCLCPVISFSIYVRFLSFYVSLISSLTTSVFTLFLSTFRLSFSLSMLGFSLPLSIFGTSLYLSSHTMLGFLLVTFGSSLYLSTFGFSLSLPIFRFSLSLTTFGFSLSLSMYFHVPIPNIFVFNSVSLSFPFSGIISPSLYFLIFLLVYVNILRQETRPLLAGRLRPGNAHKGVVSNRAKTLVATVL
jgi:hypothetical protein